MPFNLWALLLRGEGVTPQNDHIYMYSVHVDMCYSLGYGFQADLVWYRVSFQADLVKNYRVSFSGWFGLKLWGIIFRLIWSEIMGYHFQADLVWNYGVSYCNEADLVWNYGVSFSGWFGLKLWGIIFRLIWSEIMGYHTVMRLIWSEIMGYHNEADLAWNYGVSFSGWFGLKSWGIIFRLIWSKIVGYHFKADFQGLKLWGIIFRLISKVWNYGVSFSGWFGLK